METDFNVTIKLLATDISFCFQKCRLVVSISMKSKLSDLTLPYVVAIDLEKKKWRLLFMMHFILSTKQMNLTTRKRLPKLEMNRNKPGIHKMIELTTTTTTTTTKYIYIYTFIISIEGCLDVCWHKVSLLCRHENTKLASQSFVVRGRQSLRG